MSRPVIVIAEDEPRIARALAFVVEHEGGRPVVVRDGQAALDAVRRERPVLLVLDLMMPLKDGLAVTRELRAEPDYERLPILVLTALGQAETEREALAAGATLFMRKPFDPRAFRELVLDYLRG